MSLLQICLAIVANLPRKLVHRRAAAGGAPSRPATAPAARDSVLGSDPYGLWTLDEFLSSGSLSHR